MASAVFFRSVTPAARVGKVLGYAPPLRVLLGVRAFGLDLIVQAGPLRVAPRTGLVALVIFEYLLPDLPLPAVRAALESHEGQDPTARAIWALVVASTARVPAFRALTPAEVDIGKLLSACARDSLTRVH